MILIRIPAAKVAATPMLQQKGFVLQLDFPSHYVPSPSRTYPANDPLRNGGSSMINLRPEEEFLIHDAVFENAIQSGKSGGDTSFVSQILNYIDTGWLEVVQAPATILTAKQVGDYTAP
jgi:hypothetical protein